MEKREYNTRSLGLVEGCLNAGSEPLSAEEITARLNASGRKIGLTTVYRTLEKLVLRGDARRYFDGTVAVYAAAHGCDSHFHLRCRRCGKIIHLNCTRLDELSRHISEEHGFRVDRSATVLYGVCGDCLK